MVLAFDHTSLPFVIQLCGLLATYYRKKGLVGVGKGDGIGSR